MLFAPAYYAVRCDVVLHGRVIYYPMRQLIDSVLRPHRAGVFVTDRLCPTNWVFSSSKPAILQKVSSRLDERTILFLALRKSGLHL